MGEWAYSRLSGLDDNTRKRMIRNEFGGINESFYNLYTLTGNSRFLWLACFFYHDSVIGPLKKLDGDFGTMPRSEYCMSELLRDFFSGNPEKTHISCNNFIPASV